MGINEALREAFRLGEAEMIVPGIFAGAVLSEPHSGSRGTAQRSFGETQLVNMSQWSNQGTSPLFMQNVVLLRDALPNSNPRPRAGGFPHTSASTWIVFHQM